MSKILTHEKTILFIAIALIALSCKKEAQKKQETSPETQIQRIINKFPNLKLLSIKSADGVPLNNIQLKIMEDSLQAFSKELYEIKVIPKTKRVEAVRLMSDYGGAYSWTAYQNVGSASMGTYKINYFATLYYSTTYQYGTSINKFTSANALQSLAPTTSYTYPDSFFGQNIYTWSYSPVSSGSSFTGQNAFINLTFAGMVTVIHSYKIAGTTTQVSGTSEPATLNETVAASTLPTVIPD